MLLNVLRRNNMPCSSDGYENDDPPKRKGGVKCSYCGAYNPQAYKGECPQCRDPASDEDASDCSDDEESDSSSSDEESDTGSGYGTLDGATRAACEMAKLIRLGWKGSNGFKMLSPQTRAWVEHHDEVDRKRLEREKKIEQRKRLKEKALHKLSSKERKALGL
jgi:hypothetical protein